MLKEIRRNKSIIFLLVCTLSGCSSSNINHAHPNRDVLYIELCIKELARYKSVNIVRGKLSPNYSRIAVTTTSYDRSASVDMFIGVPNLEYKDPNVIQESRGIVCLVKDDMTVKSLISPEVNEGTIRYTKFIWSSDEEDRIDLESIKERLMSLDTAFNFTTIYQYKQGELHKEVDTITRDILENVDLSM